MDGPTHCRKGNRDGNALLSRHISVRIHNLVGREVDMSRLTVKRLRI